MTASPAARRAAARASDVAVLRGYGVQPHQVPRALYELGRGYSHEVAARLATRR